VTLDPNPDMRYRTVNDIDDISRDIALAVGFIGEGEYRNSLEAIRRSLNLKGFVTQFDDTVFALELDLWNLERLRARSFGRLRSFPNQCHAGIDFLIGLGQTIPVLSEDGKKRLLGRLRKGLEEGLWPLQHELAVAANLSKRGWDVSFNDLERGRGFDFLVTQNGMTFEVEAKAISVHTGSPLKPEDIFKLLVEIKRRFKWQDGRTVPVIAVKFSSNVPPDRTRLQDLVSIINKVAETRCQLSVHDMDIRFMEIIPNLGREELRKYGHFRAETCKKPVLINDTRPQVILELESGRPSKLGIKAIRTIKEAAAEQLSGRNPGIVWTHVNFVSAAEFSMLSSSRNGMPCLFDQIANATLCSQRRSHLSQLVFSGASFLDRSYLTQRSSYRAVVYDSPSCRFGNSVIFEGGRKKHSSKADEKVSGTCEEINKNA